MNTHVVEGDLLVVPGYQGSERRHSPRPATPNGAVLSAPPPHPTAQSPLRSIYTHTLRCVPPFPRLLHTILL